MFKQPRGWIVFQHKFIICAMVIITATATPKLLAAPVDGKIVNGAGAIGQSGLDTNIIQNSDLLEINWQDFSTNLNESINFSQPSADAIAINRVVGGVPSQLRGTLSANGNVFIINESGITFFDSSRVNVGALLATTAQDFKIDGDQFVSSGAESAIINNGEIKISNGGWAVLSAPYVENNGYIQANLGEINLGSATGFTLDLRGDNLITYDLSKEMLNKAGVTNNGKLQTQSGTIAVSANVASDIITATVNLDGVVDVSAFSTDMSAGSVSARSIGQIIVPQENENLYDITQFSPLPAGPIDEKSPPTPLSLSDNADKLVNYIVSLVSRGRNTQANTNLGSISPAANGDREFCASVNVGDSQICQDTGSNI